MKIYLLYTGGTIGSVGSPLKPLQGPAFGAAFQTVIAPLINSQMPDTEIEYDFFPQTLDSTNMQPSDWVTIAQKVLDNYASHDAFLILHGTDTMAWTSSALSFMLPGVCKPVLVTGSQLPLFFSPDGNSFNLLFNTDALRNVMGALQFLKFGIPEVGLYFADALNRGNRAVKSNASEFTAFTSPNFPPLGTYGVLPQVNQNLLLPAPAAQALRHHLPQVQADLQTIAQHIDQTGVIQFVIFPAFYSHSGGSLLVSMLKQIRQIDPPLKGIIFESFGAGNIPDFKEMQDVIHAMRDAGIAMVDCTQVHSGDVNYNAYATGSWLRQAGVLSGFDMTPVAALTKLIVTLARYPNAPLAQIQQEMSRNLAGEMNPDAR
ncbi:MAG: hypothetical protein RL748_3770 [Pseudomonadota bacterium]|jgi:L-asparaginase